MRRVVLLLCAAGLALPAQDYRGEAAPVATRPATILEFTRFRFLSFAFGRAGPSDFRVAAAGTGRSGADFRAVLPGVIQPSVSGPDDQIVLPPGIPPEHMGKIREFIDGHRQRLAAGAVSGRFCLHDQKFASNPAQIGRASCRERV